jgi:MSHA biogenesis protein MshQ
VSRLLRLLSLLLLLACAGARADTSMTLFKTVTGNVNYVGSQATLRNPGNGNGNQCRTLNSGQFVYATISGIPAGAVVQSAQVYFAGSGYSYQYSFYMENTLVTAPSARRYSSVTDGTSGLEYFAFGADVTSIVNAKSGGPNGTYSFYGIQVDEGNPWCSNSGVVGGYALVVIYSVASEPYRILNLYEGFKYVFNSPLSITMNNFKIPTPLPSTSKARVGHITWEGDYSISSSSEFFKLNGVELTDAYNASGNPFNSESSANNDSFSEAIDFDIFSVGGNTTIAAGQTSATTTYQTASDVVLLSAQIIAMPSVVTTDLALALTRNNSLIVNSPTSYTFTVTNNGPSNETGQIALVITVPSGMSNVSASGTGWTCNLVTVTMTCTTTAGVANGASLAAVTLSLTPTAVGTVNVTGTVGGPSSSYDSVTANNTASDSGTVASGAVAPTAYVFTSGACVHNVAFGSAGQTCTLMNWGTMYAGFAKSPIYVTAVSAGGVPTQFTTSGPTTKSMQFGLSCLNPTSANGVSATVSSTTPASVTLPVCANNGAVPTSWSSALSLTFDASSPSANKTLSFSYADVGNIQLYMAIASSSVASSTAFVQVPKSIDITTGPSSNEAGTGVKGVAGVAFSLQATAITDTGTTAPNFGRETVPEKPFIESYASGSTYTTDIPPLTGSFTAISNGVASGTNFLWEETGILKLTPQLPVTSIYRAAYTASVTTTMTEALVGRFIPAYFRTTATGPMTCATRMVCGTVASAVYAGQAFSGTVTAYTTNGSVAKNYQRDLARAVTLSSAVSNGGAAATPANGLLRSTTTTLPATAFSLGVGTSALPVSDLPNPFVNTAPLALTATAPTTIYLRALDTDAVTSLRSPAASSVEGAVRVVSGRLYVANIHGSELLPIPVKVAAQFWDGSNWQSSSTDNVSTVNPASSTITYSSCSALLSPCDAAAVTAAGAAWRFTMYPTAIQTLTGGRYDLFTIRPTGKGRDGTIEFVMSNPVAPWLPSTRAKITLGVSRSPLLYVREVF